MSWLCRKKPLPDVFLEMMHKFVGIFNSNKPANGYKVGTMLLFGKQAAAVSDTRRSQNNWQKNIDCINKEQPKEWGGKMLPVLLQSRSEAWRLLPNSLGWCSWGCSVGASKGCWTHSISWSLSQNRRVNVFYVVYQLAAFFHCRLVQIIHQMQRGEPSIASQPWPAT